ncbi:MAG: Uma2 family endonuclease [Gemmataceae bacterium]
MPSQTILLSRDVLGPESAGLSLVPREFDRAEFAEGWRYELIHGVLVVSPTPLETERDPNDELGFMLRLYQAEHPEGKALDKTLPEHTIYLKKNRRRADRAIWAGLGRLPAKKELPSAAVEFVSEGKRSWQRDYMEKRDEYLRAGIKEYWLIDRFRRQMTVFSRHGKRIKKQVIREGQTYTTPLLPGFELPIKRLLQLADAWEERGR